MNEEIENEICYKTVYNKNMLYSLLPKYIDIFQYILFPLCDYRTIKSLKLSCKTFKKLSSKIDRIEYEHIFRYKIEISIKRK